MPIATLPARAWPETKCNLVFAIGAAFDCVASKADRHVNNSIPDGNNAETATGQLWNQAGDALMLAPGICVGHWSKVLFYSRRTLKVMRRRGGQCCNYGASRRRIHRLVRLIGFFGEGYGTRGEPGVRRDRLCSLC